MGLEHLWALESAYDMQESLNTMGHLLCHDDKDLLQSSD